MKNNLFYYATSELSQDAVICYCANAFNGESSELKEEQMKKPNLFYTYGLVANSTGKTTDTNEWYTEIIAQYVLDKRLL